MTYKIYLIMIFCKNIKSNYNKIVYYLILKLKPRNSLFIFLLDFHYQEAVHHPYH